MTENTSQASHPPHETLYTLHINGQCPTQRVAKRILTAPATPVDQNDLATRPLESASRGFKLLR